jgi:metal-sulfur cluster biosynthetic enzyme
MISKEKVIEILETVFDPELGVDVWTMGLIYDINIIDEKNVKILMTFTSPLCPVGEELVEDITVSLKQLGFENVKVEVTFNPPWTPSAELREAMGV